MADTRATALTDLESLRDATGDEEIVNFIVDVYTAEKNRKRPYSIQWYYNLAFILGHQWTNISPLGELIKVEDAPEHRVYRVENEILPRVKRITSKATLDPPLMDCVPMTSDEADLNAAQAGVEFLEYHQYEQDFASLDVRALIWAQATGKGFYKTTWNPKAGPLVVREKTELQDVPVPDEMGLPQIDPNGLEITEKQEVPVLDEAGLPEIVSFHLGEISVEVCSGFEIIPVGKGDQLRSKGITGVMHVVPRSVRHVQDVYGETVEPDQDVRDTDDVYRDMAGKIGTIIGGELSSTEQREDQEPSVLVYEYWEKPSEDHPRGRLIVVAGKKVLKNTELPYDHLQLPFAEIEDFPVPGRFWPTTMVEQSIPIQKEINILASKIEEHTRMMAFPKLMTFQGNNAEEPWTNEAGQEYENASRQTMPEAWHPPQLSQDVYTRLAQLRERLDDMYSTHEASRGTVPTGVKSGVAIAFLLEQDDTQHGPLFRSYHRARETVGRHIIGLAKQFYDEDRQVSILGENKKWVMKDFNAAKLEGVADVRVRQQSSVPVSHAGAMQKVFDIAQMFPQFYVDETTGQLDHGRLSEDLQMPSVRGMHERQLLDVEQAKRENEMMMNGDPFNEMAMLQAQQMQMQIQQNPQMAQQAQPPDPNAGYQPNFFDNHPVHFREVTAFMKTAEYEALELEVKQRFVYHAQSHGQVLAKQQAPQEQQRPAQGRQTHQQSNQEAQAQ